MWRWYLQNSHFDCYCWNHFFVLPKSKNKDIRKGGRQSLALWKLIYLSSTEENLWEIYPNTAYLLVPLGIHLFLQMSCPGNHVNWVVRTLKYCWRFKYYVHRCRAGPVPLRSAWCSWCGHGCWLYPFLEILSLVHAGVVDLQMLVCQGPVVYTDMATYTDLELCQEGSPMLGRVCIILIFL